MIAVIEQFHITVFHRNQGKMIIAKEIFCFVGVKMGGNESQNFH